METSKPSKVSHRKRYLIFSIGVVALMLMGGITVRGFFDRMRAINEPNPSTVDRGAIARVLSNDRITVRIDRLFYINRDFNAYIFVGDVSRSAGTKSEVAEGEVWGQTEYAVCFPASFGEARQVVIGNRVLWGIAKSTTESEWQQGKALFWKEWAEAKQTLSEEN